MTPLFCYLRRLTAILAGGFFLLPLARGFSLDGAEAETTRPWTFWYWRQAAVTKEGIRADLEAMQAMGLGGAYLMPVQGVQDPPHLEPPVEQLSPLFWEMVRFSMEEADRLGLQLAMHACDGFAVAGGPWVTPDLSMQKVVWSEAEVSGGGPVRLQLPQPETVEGYYQDIALFAYPSLEGSGQTSFHLQPSVTASHGDNALARLLDEGNDEPLRAEEPGWIELRFEAPFTCRSIRIRPHGNNFQSMRLRLEVSDDGLTYRHVEQLQPPRHGWQDGDIPLTYAIPETTARFFRFIHDPAGSEPGAEDLDFAKWKPSLKLRSLLLSGEPRVHQFEGKSGAVWRVARPTTEAEVPTRLALERPAICDLSAAMSADGWVEVTLPPGDWTLLRMGHTSTGRTNYIGGKGKGLEIDKFSVAAARLQFDRWFGEAIRQAGPDLAGRVLKGFHVDSWEAGSQNWTADFREAFRARRGYDPLPWLPAMAGRPVESAADSERFLLDVRRTISELLNERFFGTMQELAAEAGCWFSAESVAPTMMADSLLHFSTVGIPMGEFWLRSPTHDKPTDVLDAISGGRLYGRRLIQAEAFTELRMAWNEHPGMLKALGDRHLAQGVNRFVFHVFMHNPWLDRTPGMTLDGVGLYFQRDQTWWKPGRAWVDYLTRCQALLQAGWPVVDVAVFHGEDLPARSVLPEELGAVLPGLVGEARLQREASRLANAGQPLREAPKGVVASAHIRDGADWVDPLSGYAYDTINRDALLRLATVRDGRLLLPGGSAYRLLVIPGPRRSAPDPHHLSLELAEKLANLAEAGLPILMEGSPVVAQGPDKATAERARQVERRLAAHLAGRGLIGPWWEIDLAPLGAEPDLVIRPLINPDRHALAWTHRREGTTDRYFLSHQAADSETYALSFRQGTGHVSLYDPVTDRRQAACVEAVEEGRIHLRLHLGPNESRFVLFERGTLPDPNPVSGPTAGLACPDNTESARPVAEIHGPWQVRFDPRKGGPEAPQKWTRLVDWSTQPDPDIRAYSGTAVYCTSFDWNEPLGSDLWLRLGVVHNLAALRLNGHDLGVAWTWPYERPLQGALRPGENHLCIEVTNTWANRLIADQASAPADRLTRTTAPFRLEGEPLLPSGLLGPVRIFEKASQSLSD